MNNDNGNLIAWQWQSYGEAHRDRANLAIHLLTVPLFAGGTLALPLALLLSPWLAPAGLAAMAAAIGLQGRGHRHEQTAPRPFRGPWDVLRRIFVEQWITFPRFVFTGGLARAWRAAAPAR